MTETKSGLRSSLSLPIVYELVQRIFGARSGRRDLVERFIRPRPGDRILDVGCGPAAVLRFMHNVQYVGYDLEAQYIERARKHFAGQGQFFTGRFGPDDAAAHKPFDIAILIGVLHHLDDDEASDLLRRVHSVITPGGRLVTLDNVFIEDQNPVARKLIEWDRGHNVRSASGYRALVAPYFGSIRETVIHKTFPPYTLFVMECAT